MCGSALSSLSSLKRSDIATKIAIYYLTMVYIIVMMHAIATQPETCPVPAFLSHAAKIYVGVLSCISLALCSAAWYTNWDSPDRNNALASFSMIVVSIASMLIIGILYTIYQMKGGSAQDGYQVGKGARIVIHLAIIFIDLFSVGVAAIAIHNNTNTAQYVLACAVLVGFFAYRACFTSVSLIEVACIRMPDRLKSYSMWGSSRLSYGRANAEMVAAEVMSTSMMVKPAKRYVDGQWM